MVIELSEIKEENIMEWTYLSHKLSNDTPLYNGSGQIVIDQYRKISLGDSCSSTRISLPVHTGSHIDAPAHFDELGRTIDEYDADFWITKNPALILTSLDPGSLISLNMVIDDLEVLSKSTDIILFKTGAEKWRGDGTERYTKMGIGLDVDLCHWIRNNLNLKFIGLDSISLSSPMHREIGRAAHKALLSSRDSDSNPVLIIEDLSLDSLRKPPKSIIAIPLQIEDADGAMATVLANID